MPQCKECGKVYQSSFDSGLCEACSRIFSSKPLRLPSTKVISKSSYDLEVERISKAQPAQEKIAPVSNVRGLVIAIVFPILFIACVVLAYLGYGFTKHFAVWALSSLFFLLGLVMFLTKRITWRGDTVSDSLEPTAADAIYMIVGSLWLLPFVLCACYYSTSDDLPSNRPLWFVGFALVGALLAQIICSLALKPTRSA